MNPIILWIGFLLSFIFAIYWVIRRRRKIKRETFNDESTLKYTKTQILGILGIVLFLMPIFLIVFSNLVRGVLILTLVFFRLIHIPELMISALIAVIVPFLYFLMLIGTYIVAEFIWPKKEILKS